MRTSHPRPPDERKIRARRAAARVAWLVAALTTATPSLAQTPTPHPEAWRPISYADLQRPSSATATYADIWKDAIDANNHAYRTRGDTRFANGNAPVTEAHFIIWSSKKSVVLSILDTAIGCSDHFADRAVHAKVKLCPLRIAEFEGATVNTKDGGKVCFLELDPSSSNARIDAAKSVAYASYDVATKTIKTGMIVDHKVVDGCSNSIPLYPR